MTADVDASGGHGGQDVPLTADRFRSYLGALWASPEHRFRLTAAAGAGGVLAYSKGIVTMLICLAIGLAFLPLGYRSYRRNGDSLESPSRAERKRRRNGA